MNHLNEKPEINISGLNEKLATLKGKLSSLIPYYQQTAEFGGFFGVFATLLSWISDIWTDFENNSCGPLAQTAREFRQAKREFNAAALLAVYGEALQRARAELYKTILELVVAKIGRGKERLAQLMQVSEELPELVYQLWLHEFRMTGDGMLVEPVDYEAHQKRFWLWFAAIAAGEVALGFYLFELSSSSIFAFVLSITTAMGIMFSRHIATGSKILINTVKDAEAAYNKNFPVGRNDREGNLIQLYPISRTVVDKYRKATLTYWLTVTGLLVWRVWVSLYDPAAGITGVFGSFAMVILSMVYSWVNSYPKFQKELQEEWQRMQDAKANLELSHANLSVPDPDDSFESELTAAKELYYQAADAAKREVAQDPTNRRKIAEQFLSLLDQYQQALLMCRRIYETLWPQACTAVTKLKPAANQGQFDSRETTQEVDRLFSRTIRPTLEDAGLAQEAAGFNPAVQITAEPMTEEEMARHISEIRTAVETEENTRTAFRAVLANRTEAADTTGRRN